MGNYIVTSVLFAIAEVKHFPIHSKIVATSVKNQKRVGHCSNAVPRSKSTCTMASGSNGSYLDTKHASTIVVSSLKNSGESSNWRLNYYRFKHLSFAQVLKRAIGNQ